MYSILLILHSALRWIFLGVAVNAIFRAFSGMTGKKVFDNADSRAGAILVAVAHTQLLIGLVLWFISPAIQELMAHMADTMKNSAARLQLVEHPLTMIIAVALIQIGRIRSKKAYLDELKHRRSLIFYGIALLLVLSRIPWSSVPMIRLN